MDPMEVDRATFRRQSIGTLTGWQLLAQSVEQTKDDAASSSTKQQHDQQAAKSRPQRSSSGGSDMSEDSGGGHVAQALVQPRPHQWLYKEYKIQDEIGSGGFGRVCRARRLTDGKVVVVKEIKTTSLSAKQKAATMDEVEVLAKFNHPNIVKYHDCFMDDVYINIVMEYCNAGDLTGLLKQRAGQRLPEPEIMSLFVQICLALVYVHSAGVLHRDLKCSNVLITSAPGFSGMPLLKLGDFGVAKISGPESSMASTIVGTPQYLSPEMCDNKPYGKKSDVWALGCILYELCTLTKAFDLGNGGISGIILKIISGTYTPLPECYSAEMKALVGSMLQTDPNARPLVSEILEMPYVRQHLQSYLEWARNVPEAHPEVLLTSLGEQYKRGAASSSSSSSNLGKASTSSQPASSPRAAAAAAPAGDGSEAAAAASSRAAAAAAGLPPQLSAAAAGSDAASAAPPAAAAAVEPPVQKGTAGGSSSSGSGGAQPGRGGAPLTTLLSMDRETHVSHCAAML
ncbi:hypothetical protein OEZ86_004446 [Tetradesmus obliquus]|nr:hypothetical protein OEZ86_004446 [Tetradesmus obliquus]